MKWQVVLKKIKIRKFTPVTAGNEKIKRKKKLRNRLKKQIGKKLPGIKKSAEKHLLCIDVCFYLQESKKLGRPKKDLDNLLKILFDALSDNMIHGQKPVKGLGIMRDDSYINKIICEKKLVKFKNQEGFDLKILKDPSKLPD